MTNIRWYTIFGWGLFFLTAAALAWVFVYTFVHSKYEQHFHDTPDRRKMHQRLVPRVGGVCIILSIFILIIIWHFTNISFLPTLKTKALIAAGICTLILFCLGIFDDTCLMHIRVRYKFIVEFFIAFFFVFFLNINVDRIFILGLPIKLGLIGIIFSAIWIVGAANSFNFTDGIDGLAGGISFISLAVLTIIGIESNQTGMAFLCVIIAGAVLGFLFHNYDPAEVFLGDTGSLFLGMAIALVSVNMLSAMSVPAPVYFFIIGLPVIEVFVSIVRRFRKAWSSKHSIKTGFRAMVIPDSNHIHHRLLYCGLSHRQVANILYFVQIISCTIALAIIKASLPVCIVLYIIFTIFICGFIFWLYTQKVIFSAVKKTINSKEKFHVGMAVRDVVISHALKNSDGHPLNITKGMPDIFYNYQLEFDAVIIDEKMFNLKGETEKFIKEILNIHQCPVFLILNTDNKYELNLPNEFKHLVHFINKPIYIPPFINELNNAIEEWKKMKTDWGKTFYEVFKKPENKTAAYMQR